MYICVTVFFVHAERIKIHLSVNYLNSILNRWQLNRNISLFMKPYQITPPTDKVWSFHEVYHEHLYMKPVVLISVTMSYIWFSGLFVRVNGGNYHWLKSGSTGNNFWMPEMDKEIYKFTVMRPSFYPPPRPCLGNTCFPSPLVRKRSCDSKVI